MGPTPVPNVFAQRMFGANPPMSMDPRVGQPFQSPIARPVGMPPSSPFQPVGAPGAFLPPANPPLQGPIASPVNGPQPLPYGSAGAPTNGGIMANPNVQNFLRARLMGMQA